MYIIWFLHFDDWKLGTEIPEWFSKFTIPIKEKWNIEELFETCFTKTFKFTNAVSESDRKLGFMYFLIAFGMVSQPCYLAHIDWLSFMMV